MGVGQTLLSFQCRMTGKHYCNLQINPRAKRPRWFVAWKNSLHYKCNQTILGIIVLWFFLSFSFFNEDCSADPQGFHFQVSLVEKAGFWALGLFFMWFTAIMLWVSLVLCCLSLAEASLKVTCMSVQTQCWSCGRSCLCMCSFGCVNDIAVTGSWT